MGDPPTIQPIVLRLSSESGLTISEVIEALYAPAEYEKATAVKKPRNPRRRLSKFKPYETEPADLTSEIWTPETALEGTLPSQNGLGDVQPFAPTPPSILQLVHFSPSPSEGEEQVSVKSSLAVSLPRSHRPVECAGAGSPRSAPEIIDAGANSDVELIEPPAAPCVKSKTPLFLSNPDSDTEVDAARVSENLHDDSTTPLTIKLPASVAFAVASLVFGKLGAILQPLTPLLGPTASNPLNPPPQMHLDDQQATPELRASSIARGRRLDRSRARDFSPSRGRSRSADAGVRPRIPTGDTRAGVPRTAQYDTRYKSPPRRRRHSRSWSPSQRRRRCSRTWSPRPHLPQPASIQCPHRSPGKPKPTHRGYRGGRGPNSRKAKSKR